MPHVIWDEDLDEIQGLIDEVRVRVNPLPIPLVKKLVRIEKLLKSVRGESKPDQGNPEAHLPSVPRICGVGTGREIEAVDKIGNQY